MDVFRQAFREAELALPLLLEHELVGYRLRSAHALVYFGVWAARPARQPLDARCGEGKLPLVERKPYLFLKTADAFVFRFLPWL